MFVFPPLPFVLKQVVVLAVLLESIKCPCPTCVSRFCECQTRISLRTLNPKQHLPSADKAWNAHNQSTGSHCRERNKRLPYKQPHTYRQSITVLLHTMAQLRKTALHPENTQLKPKSQLKTNFFSEKEQFQPLIGKIKKRQGWNKIKRTRPLGGHFPHWYQRRFCAPQRVHTVTCPF